MSFRIKGGGMRVKGAAATAASSVASGYTPAAATHSVLIDEDFLDGAIAGLFAVAASGTGTSTIGLGDQGAPGYFRCATGVTVAGRESYISSAQPLLFGNTDVYTLRERHRVTPLSTVAEQWVTRFGFGDTVGAAQVDGAHFEGDSSVFANWQCVVSSNSVRSTADSGVAIPLNTWQSFKIVATNASILFYIDGNLVATIATNIPSGAGRNCGVFGHVIKAVGTVNSGVLDTDYINLVADFTTQRGSSV